ncbi:MAG: hypothetical protein K8R63_02525 [Bacteroidales bacterium]|nr:hypothetical protein [Bacteroidales bacterium]
MRAVLILLLICSVVCLSSCKDEFEVRVKNDYPQELNIAVGPTNFGLVASGTTTPYRDIEEGTHQITGDLQGSLTISGSGKYKGTITIDPNGNISLKKD